MKSVLILRLAAALLLVSAGARPDGAAMEASSRFALSARDSALHVLNRFAYGPLPGQVDRVARAGALAWLDAQLALDGRSDLALAAREKRYPALALDAGDWARLFVAARKAARAQRALMLGTDAPDLTPEAGSGPPRKAGRRRVPERADVRRRLDEVRALAMLRAVTAEAQAREVMADFWINHFNVFLNKGADRFLLPGYVETVIRPRALGRFEDLLIAVAKSPAMLFYLDNVQSVATGTEGMPRGRKRPPGAKPRPRGINENYARELLELHTLGVDAGYTQADVIDVARILTGWSMAPPARGGGFMFRPGAHDAGEKTVLGVRFPAGHGEDEGVRLLEMLARHPATVRHVCEKLCARFVADDPPDGAVDAAVAAWRRSDGDMREVLRAIARAPEFWAATAVRSKVKTPLEFVASAARAVGAVPDSTGRLAAAVARLGQPLYLQPSPAGYPERQEQWANSGALLDRMNFAVALAAGQQPGAAVNLDALVPVGSEHGVLVDAIDDRVLGGAMTGGTRRVILEQIADVPDEWQARALAVGLALGGPEFQRQ